MQKLILRLVFCPLFLAIHLASGQAEVQQWTNQSGQTIQAKFVRGDDETVILFMNGRNYAYQLEDLSEKSRKLARELITASAPKASPHAPKPLFPTPAPKGENGQPGYDASEIRIAVNEHNRLRREVGVPELKWDQDLARDAMEWAIVMAREQELEHSEGNDEGENISWAKGYGRARCIEIALKGWGDKEKVIYLSRGEPAVGEKGFQGVGHYTQMVWRSTTRVGMATVRSKDGSYYTCARYSPAGNFVGERPYPGKNKKR